MTDIETITDYADQERRDDYYDAHPEQVAHCPDCDGVVAYDLADNQWALEDAVASHDLFCEAKTAEVN